MAIGSSAGGLEALQEFFSHVPANTGMAFIVVTHVRPGRDSMLPELLGTVTKMDVISAGDSTAINPNQVIVARDSILNVSHGVMMPAKSDGAQEATYHPIDYFFRSLAEDQQEHAIGIILSGSGNDGALGLKAIKAVGGMVMVQSPDSAKYTGMPDSAIATHMADYVLPPNEMPNALLEYCRGPYLTATRRAVDKPLLPEAIVQAILARLHAHSGQDFTCYKRSTMSRRIQRRMNVHQIDDPQAYLTFLRENAREMDSLMEELLISVTSFFRDPPAWQALSDVALPRLLREIDDRQPLRVWVPGCATGEEAYSISILIHEHIRQLGRSHAVQIFATDLDERAIDFARAGRYPGGISADVSPVRLKMFFTPEDGVYRINKTVRDSIVFALQNVISDPPFTRLDLIICRNVLIYLDTSAQQHVLANFHYALRPGGLLFLGSAETAGQAGQLFEPIDGRHEILRRRDVAKSIKPVLRGSPRRGRSEVDGSPERGSPAPDSMMRRVTQLLLDRYVPCSILVNDHGTVVHVQGRSGMFLELEQGAPRNSILEMAREGLAPSLSAAMREARHEDREVTRSGIRVKTNGGHTLVDLNVLPLAQPESMRGLLLLTLRLSTTPSSEHPSPAGGKGAAEAPNHLDLERELQHARENLQTTIEELETTNEEVKSSNEELQSTNEELQSTNEELETSKEEMQSLNEELTTLNSELQAKVQALARVNDDLNNLLNSMQVATIFLDTRIRVKRYTDQARDVVRLISSDIGRPLSDLTSTLVYPALIDDCERVLANLIPMEKEIQNKEGRWYLVRLMPYRTSENAIEGLVMTIVDIDRTKQAEASLRQSLEDVKQGENILTAMMEHIPMGITIADAESMKTRTISRFGRELAGRRANVVVGIDIDQHVEAFDIYRADGVTRAKPDELPLVRATKDGEIVRNEVWVITRPDGVRIPILCTAAPIRTADGRIAGGVTGWQDITEQKRIEEELRRREEKYRSLIESIDEGFSIVQVMFDEQDKPVDYRFLEVNPSFERQTGLKNATGRTMRQLSPGHEEHWFETYGRIAKTGQPERFEGSASSLGRWYDVFAWRYGSPDDHQVAILFNDITGRKNPEMLGGGHKG